MPESTRKLLIASVLLLLLTNAVVLAGVAWNRSGEPITAMELSERELPVARNYYRMDDENSGTALNLKWKVFDEDDTSRYSHVNYGRPGWLDNSKLSELGFDLAVLSQDKYRDRLYNTSADVIVVLEYQGDTYHQDIEQAKARVKQLGEEFASFPEDEDISKQLDWARERLEELRVNQTRLYAIDAGLDAAQLMQRYTDSDKYLFVPGQVGLSFNSDDDEIVGHLSQLLIRQIHVPLPYSRLLAKLNISDKEYSYISPPVPPRYQVTVNVGKRLEPWLSAIDAAGK